METPPTRKVLNALAAIRQIRDNGWSEIAGIDMTPCIRAGWVLATDERYRLTRSGEDVLGRYGAESLV